MELSMILHSRRIRTERNEKMYSRMRLSVLCTLIRDK